jgi:hypothetical protein
VNKELHGRNTQEFVLAVSASMLVHNCTLKLAELYVMLMTWVAV